MLGKQKTAKEIWSCPGLNNHTDSDHICSVLQACGTDILRSWKTALPWRLSKTKRIEVCKLQGTILNNSFVSSLVNHSFLIDYCVFILLYYFFVFLRAMCRLSGDDGCVRVGNLDLDFKILISDLQSNAKSENGFQRWDICFWIFIFTVRLGNPKKDLKNCP